MTHSKTFKRDDGSRVEVRVSLYDGRYNSEPMRWEFQVKVCPPNKRKFDFPNDQDNYTYRALSMEDRRKHNIAQYLKVATPAEILQTKMELWNKLKPE